MDPADSTVYEIRRAMLKATYYFTNRTMPPVDANPGVTGSLVGNSVACPDLLSTLQNPIKELGSRRIGPHPVLPPQEAVNLIWQNELFERYVLRP